MSDAKQEIPIHADFDRAPGLIEGSTTYELSPFECDVEWWIKSVAQGSLMGLDHGVKADSKIPDFLLREGPLRDNLIVEFAFRSITEWEATRICALATYAAPNVEGMEFYSTQTLDEARHANTFRNHLIELGVPKDELVETMERVARDDADKLIKPIRDWALPLYLAGLESGTAWIDSVGAITILLEGVLAPTTELSELKWKGISPATANIERGACVDEIRHLSVGSWIVRDYVQKHPEDRARMVEALSEGRSVWASLPTAEIIFRRESQFQEGILENAKEIGDYEIFPGRRLIDTTPEERVLMALKWSEDIQNSRLMYMGLEEAIIDMAQVSL
jgi:hypothetical protein